MPKLITGMDQVLARIQSELMGIERRTYKGMYMAMKHLENEMDTSPPLVPIDTKFMRDSWFILGDDHPTNPIIFAGYTAPYAPIVHEKLGVVNWTRTNSGPKWLQIHFSRNILEMKLIVGANVRIR